MLSLCNYRPTFTLTIVASCWTFKDKVALTSSLFRTKYIQMLFSLSDGCSPNPCLNGGNCYVEDKLRKCHCRAPFTGPRCEEDPSASKCST